MSADWLGCAASLMSSFVVEHEPAAVCHPSVLLVSMCSNTHTIRDAVSEELQAERASNRDLAAQLEAALEELHEAQHARVEQSTTQSQHETDLVSAKLASAKEREREVSQQCVGW